MIVHIIGSLRNNIETDASYLQQIADIVHDEGHVLAQNWLNAAIVRQKDEMYIADWEPFVQSNLDAIKRADLVIADLTHYTLSHGFLMAAALDGRKPVLALSRESLAYRSVSGITTPLLHSATYSDRTDIDKDVRAFIKKNVVHTKDLRFNMFLTREIVQYLDGKSDESGVNRSEIIRKLIRNNFRRNENNE